MKPSILHKTIATLLLALPIAHAEDKKPDGKKEDREAGEVTTVTIDANGKKETRTIKKEGGSVLIVEEGAAPNPGAGKPLAPRAPIPLGGKQNAASSSVVASADGTATITVDINGKKETRTFKLGDGNNTFSVGDDGAKGGGSVQFGGGKIGAPGQPNVWNAKHEKGPWLGIAMEPVQEVVASQLSLAPGEGVVINHVAPESPAAKAGLQPNDILLRFEDQIIVEQSQLKKLIAMKKAGDSVKLTYLRKGAKKDASVTLVEHDLESGEHGPMQWLQMPPGGGGFKAGGAPGSAPNPWGAVKGGGGYILDERMQDQLKQLKEKHPGMIVEKRSWVSGEQGDLLKGQIEKLLRGLEESKLPKEQIEHLRKELQRAQHEADEAMENAKRNPENSGFKPREKEKGEEKKKADKPL